MTIGIRCYFRDQIVEKVWPASHEKTARRFERLASRFGKTEVIWRLNARCCRFNPYFYQD